MLHYVRCIEQFGVSLRLKLSFLSLIHLSLNLWLSLLAFLDPRCCGARTYVDGNLAGLSFLISNLLIEGWMDAFVEVEDWRLTAASLSTWHLLLLLRGLAHSIIFNSFAVKRSDASIIGPKIHCQIASPQFLSRYREVLELVFYLGYPFKFAIIVHSIFNRRYHDLSLVNVREVFLEDVSSSVNSSIFKLNQMGHFFMLSSASFSEVEHDWLSIAWRIVIVTVISNTGSIRRQLSDRRCRELRPRSLLLMIWLFRWLHFGASEALASELQVQFHSQVDRSYCFAPSGHLFLHWFGFGGAIIYLFYIYILL